MSRAKTAERRPAPINLCAAAAAAARGVAFAALASRRREKAKISGARQLAVYLQHVAFGESLSGCAELFGRDRATVRHACARIEDARDDPARDRALQSLEAALKAQRDMIFFLIDCFTAPTHGDSSCPDTPPTPRPAPPAVFCRP